jgi:hypothetical protein
LPSLSASKLLAGLAYKLAYKLAHSRMTGRCRASGQRGTSFGRRRKLIFAAFCPSGLVLYSGEKAVVVSQNM